MASPLLYDDTQNTALRQVLSAHLSIGELALLTRVCRAFRPWLVENDAQLFLGVTDDDAEGEHRVLRPWKPHLLLNGQPALCKKRLVHVFPRIYSCCGRTADGRQLVKRVPRGANVDILRSGVSVMLVHASSREPTETLLCNFPLFTTMKPPKDEPGPCYDTYHMGGHIQTTLSRHRTPPGRYRLRVVLHLVLRNREALLENYTYTSDAFYVVAAPPRTAAAVVARRDEPPRRSSVV